MLRKDKIFKNLGKNFLKFENVLKKCMWLRGIKAHNTLLEKALEHLTWHGCSSDVYRKMKPDLIYIEFIGTIQSGN